MMRRVILAALLWVGVAGGMAAAAPPPAAGPDFPTLSGRVVDAAGLLNAAQAAALTDTLAALERKTTDQVVVVTLPSLKGIPIEEYGYQLGRHWGIGQKGKDSGALLIVAANDHAVRIEVGYGLEGVLTDAATKTIIDSDILPRFKAGDFPGGIAAGVADIDALLGGDAVAATADTGPAPKLGTASAWPAIGIGLAAVVLLIFCAMTGGFICRAIFQVFFLMAFSGRGSSGGGQSSSSSFSGGGGSFGGGGSSGSW